MYETSGVMTKFAINLKIFTFELAKARQTRRKATFMLIGVMYLCHLTAIVLSSLNKQPSEYALYEWLSIIMDWISTGVNGMLLIVGRHVGPRYSTVFQESLNANLYIRIQFGMAMFLAVVALLRFVFATLSSNRANCPFSRNTLIAIYVSGYTIINIIFHIVFLRLHPTAHTYIFGCDRSTMPFPFDKTVDQFVLEIEYRYREVINEQVGTILDQVRKAN